MPFQKYYKIARLLSVIRNSFHPAGFAIIIAALLSLLVTPEKAESEEEDGIENDFESGENLENCEQRKTIKVKPFGGPLLAQT